nr:hypothetical protein [Tanacetum cinerariifolium]
MDLSTMEDETSSADQIVHKPEEIEWQMLDKPKFFFLGAGLFSCVSATLYPVVVLKTKQQVSLSHLSSLKTAFSIIRYEGFRGLYRGFGTSLVGTIPARALYMTALEVTKSNVGASTVKLGFPEPSAAAVANAVAGLTAALAAQLDGPKGLYRGFGISVMTYAPSHAVWWASYSVAQRLVWGRIGSYMSKKDEDSNVVAIRPDSRTVMAVQGVSAAMAGVAQRLVWGRIGSYMSKKDEDSNVVAIRPDSRTVMAVQGVSAAMAGGVSALVTMPLDTIKTRLQVLDNNSDDNNGRKGLTVGQTVRNLVKDGGLMALYRGLGPRCASMSMSATTMITTYELLKRLSTKNQEHLVP